MLTAEQIRAARNALRWTIEDLSKQSAVSVRALKMIEQNAGQLTNRLSTVEKIQRALEAVGIEFIGTPDDAPGIRIHRAQTD